jgi:phage tail sheath gpL-like
MTIASNLRVPFMYVEFDSSRAFQGSAILNYKALLIGQLLSTGSKYDASANAVGPFRVSSADQAAQFFGSGSMLHRMAKSWFANNRTTELFVIGLKDNGTTKAAGTIALTGTATASGALAVYINGELLSIPVGVSDAAATIATALAAAVTSKTSLPVTASAATGTVTFTAKNAGTVGNAIDIRINYNDGDETPAGVSATVTAMASGATDPVLSDAIALMGEEWYNIMVSVYYDATNLTAIETELSSRAAGARMIDGVYVVSRRGSLSDLSTFGDARNSPYVTCMNYGGVTGVGGPTWTAEVAAAYGAQLAFEGASDPNRGFQTLELKGVLPPSIAERFDVSENNTLLYDGISTFSVDRSNVVRIQRAITMYQRNSAGADDIAYLDVTTILTLMYLRYSFRTRILTKYNRAKLADDGVQVGPNQQIITPSIGKAEAVALFREWQLMGLVENADQFKKDLQCYRSASDPNRLEWVLPPDLVNQFLVGAANIQFLLQS